MLRGAGTTGPLAIATRERHEMTQETSTLTYAVGDVVTYRTWGDGLRTGVITEKFDDVKNGEPGFDMKISGSEGGMFWGYDTQIVEVIPKRLD
jgi:hypothetical protein